MWIFCFLTANDQSGYLPGFLTVCFSEELIGNTTGTFKYDFDSDGYLVTLFKRFKGQKVKTLI